MHTLLYWVNLHSSMGMLALMVGSVMIRMICGVGSEHVTLS